MTYIIEIDVDEKADRADLVDLHDRVTELVSDWANTATIMLKRDQDFVLVSAF